jgi:hypothetical protein
VPNTRRDVDAELRGNVHLRYTVLHDSRWATHSGTDFTALEGRPTETSP